MREVFNIVFELIIGHNTRIGMNLYSECPENMEILKSILIYNKIAIKLN